MDLLTIIFRRTLVVKLELEKILVEECPLLYREYHGDRTKTCMARGMECGDGWFDLLRSGSRRIEQIIRTMKEEGVPEQYLPKAVQVKEKFRVLTFYMRSSTDVIDSIIAEMTQSSLVTCELCGSAVAKSNRGRC